MAAHHSYPPSLPPLSPTYQTSQLMTPQHLHRVTIDQPNYHGYLSHSLQTEPPHLNAIQRRVSCYGDKYFHFHKDIPVSQPYSLTTLHLSNLRPWDQIVDRPLSTGRVIQKELPLPFPTSHPYTSHISQFAVFPNTHPHYHPSHTTLPTHTSTQAPHSRGTPSPKHSLDSSTQTPPISTIHASRPATPYYVTHKASERGIRIEQQSLSATAGHVTSGWQGQLWDLPRSHGHQRSQTYPSPLHQYHSSPTHPPSHTHLHTSPHTHEALRTIHTLTSHTTTYKTHFSPPHSTSLPTRTRFQERRSFSAFSSKRPHTAESRGKYCRYFSQSAGREEEEEGGDEESRLGREARRGSLPKGWMGFEGGDGEGEGVSGGGVDGEEGGVEMRTIATQTDLDDDHFPPLLPLTPSSSTPLTPSPSTPLTPSTHAQAFETTSIPLTQTLRGQATTQLPLLTTGDQIVTTADHATKTGPKLAEATQRLDTSPHKRSSTQEQVKEWGLAVGNSGMEPRHRRSLSADAVSSVPRSVLSARRFSELYGFSRSEVLRRFHQQYPEQAPDLRQYGLQSGRRHVIHGYNAYCFH